MQEPRRRVGRLLAGLAVIAATGITAPAVASAAPAAGATGTAQNYVVLFKGTSSPANAATLVGRAGGSVVADYAQIGVLIARSSNTAFAQNVGANSSVEGASATGRYAAKLPAPAPTAKARPGTLPNAPASDTDPFSPLQWDMRQMQVPQAHAITGGSPAVLVGDIDTGVDFGHPDLKPNLDVADSVNCVSGAPVPGLAAQDDQGHGTHTAGTIAAAANGIGIVGVAPNVRLAAIKSGDATGSFFPESVICGFVWAGTHHMDVTNNSYFADPYLYNCRNDAAQRAIWKAEQRAIRFAMDQGTTVVAAEGNESEDLSHPTIDATSPDNVPVPDVREITNACVTIPVEIPGVIGVTSTGSLQQGTSAGRFADHLKAYYSSFGQSSADLTAPGGDYYWRGADPAAQATLGLVLSTWPAALSSECADAQQPTGDPAYPTAYYCLEQGTSMASPHVAGLAALVISRFGDLKNTQNGTMRPGQVEQYVEQTADPQACPTTLPDSTELPGVNYTVVTGVNSGAVQQCTGGPGHNSWYGNGEANALAAVTHDTSNH